ncbi:MAG TPA: polysaccharide biosynthesis tyrosine autokinase [Lacipirellulaceae bacterium]|nr:polysaccharide biosynthesis tyrosine autokinase [Lacipirellulaceae bacterium]
MSNHSSAFPGPPPSSALEAPVSRAIVAAPAAPALGGSTYSPRGPEILSGGFNQVWLGNCLRRRWLMASLLGLLIGGSVGALLIYLFPESSRITAYLEVKSKTAGSAFDDNQRAVSPLEIQREAAMHPALIKSPGVLEAALIRPDIAELDAVQSHKPNHVLWLLDELKVSFAAESPILEVRYEGDENAEDMIKIVNAVVKSYRDNVLFQDQVTQNTTRDDLKSVLASVQAELQRKFEELKSKTEASGQAHFEDFEFPKLKSDISMFQQQLISVSSDITNLEVMKQVALQQANSPAALETAVAAELDKDPTINEYKMQIFQANQALQSAMASTRNQASAQIRRMQGTVQQLEQAMAQHRASAERDARERLAKMPNEALRAVIVEHNVRAKYLADKKAQLEKDLAAAEARIAQMSVVDPELEMLEQEIESQQELISSLSLQIRKWDAESRAQTVGAGRDKQVDYEKVRVVQPALATEQINTTERYAIAGLGGLSAMALTCYTIALVEFRRRRLNGPSDIEEGLGVRVLGVLPSTSLKALTGHSLVASQVAEAVDNVRATIMHDSTSRPRQIVMVTSPATMEGCTTVAASLALSLARAGRRTLLVDGDLRSPSLHKLFGMPLDDGLSEVLRSEIDLADAIHPTASEGLHLLTAGVGDMDAIHALATDQPQAIFDKLRDQFDFVVIDAPPVLGISDALNIGQYVDGAILTVLRDQSELRNVYHAIETLRVMGVRLIGSVVNGVPTKADRRVVRLHQAGNQRTPRLPAVTPAE